MTFKIRLAVLSLLTLFSLCMGHAPTITKGIPHGLSPAKNRLLRRTRKQLKLVKKALRCTRTRSETIMKLYAKAHTIRKCLYNGLGFRKYRELREVCRTRSETLEEVRVTRRRCARMTPKRRGRCERKKLLPAKEMRKAAEQACLAIGWDGKKERCEGLQPVKEAIKEAEGVKCGDGESEEELLHLIVVLGRKIAVILKMGTPEASGVPRAA